MKEKLLFIGLLILSVLYWIEVFGSDSYEWYQYAGLGITLVTVIPWLIGILVSLSKKGKDKEKEEAYAASKAKSK